MSCGQACDGCNERAQHHLCPACANEDIDNLKKQLREAQAEVERLRASLQDAIFERDATLADLSASQRANGRVAMERDEAQAEVARFKSQMRAADDLIETLRTQKSELLAEELQLRDLVRDLRGYITPSQEQFAPILARVDARLKYKP